MSVSSIASSLHVGTPFTDDDATVEAMLAEVSVPTLLCSMVHITGDPDWIRDPAIAPAGLFLNEYQGFMSAEAKAEARARALRHVLAFRDGGCVLPSAPEPDLVREMMSFLACAEVPDDVMAMMLAELNLDGRHEPGVIGIDDIDAETREQFPVVVIGCGQSGLLAGIRLRQAGIPFTIIERNSGAGGTWFQNCYPGARVDVGSHFYCYSFEPADHWTEYFSRQPELARYFADVMHRHGVAEHVRFDTEVVGATLDEATGTWTVSIRSIRPVGDGGGTGDVDAGKITELKARAVISAVGALNLPLLPDIDGMHDFAGPWFHSIRWDHSVDHRGKRVALVGAGATGFQWDHSVDHRGKRVALVGAGATGFQIAPTIAEEVEHLSIFQRTAQWMFPNPNYHEAVPAGMKWAIRHLPYFGRWFRFLILWPGAGIDLAGPRIDPDWDASDGLAVSERNLATRSFFLGFMTEQVGDDGDLLAKVTPDYPATGKRTLQDNGSWLQCLKKPNVDLVRLGIERIEATGVRTVDGQLHSADIIVYATGFRHNEYLWPMQIRGRGAQLLNEFWGDEPGALYGITVPGFPNLFCMYGPGTNLASGGSLIFHSECQITYIMACLERMLRDRVTTMEPTAKAYDDYNRKLRSEIGRMVWSHRSIEHSHYKNAKGDVHTLSPWPLHLYHQWTLAPDFGQYELH